MSFTFNSIHASDKGLVVQTAPSILPPVDVETQSVKGRAGAYFRRSQLGMGEINVKVSFIANDLYDYHTRLRNLASWLKTDEPVPLVFDKEPDKTYYAILSGDTSVERTARMGEGTLTFLCPDPYAYSPEEEVTIDSATHTANINNDSNTDLYPKYHFKFNQDSTYLIVATENGPIQIGEPAGIDDEVTYIQRKPILIDTFSDFTGWSETGVVEDDWHKAGSIEYVDSSPWNGFQAKSFGTYDETNMSKGWHGPSLVKALPEPVQDFDFYYQIDFTNNSSVYEGTARSRYVQMGRICLYFLDANDSVVGMTEIHDTTRKAQKATGYARLGAKSPSSPVVMDYWRHPRAYVYNNHYSGFVGRLYGGRRGNRWFFQPGLFSWGGDERVVGWRKMFDYIDKDGIYSAPISKIQLAFLKYKDDNHMTMLGDAIRLYARNVSKPAPNKRPVIFNKEDEVIIDTERGQIYKNGELFMEGINPASQFKPLPLGENAISAEPVASTKEAYVTYRKRWL